MDTTIPNNNPPAEAVKPPTVATLNDRRLARIEWAHTRLMTYLVIVLVTINIVTLVGVVAILAILMHSIILPSSIFAPAGP